MRQAQTSTSTKFLDTKSKVYFRGKNLMNPLNGATLQDILAPMAILHRDVVKLLSRVKLLIAIRVQLKSHDLSQY